MAPSRVQDVQAWPQSRRQRPSKAPKSTPRHPTLHPSQPQKRKHGHQDGPRKPSMAPKWLPSRSQEPNMALWHSFVHARGTTWCPGGPQEDQNGIANQHVSFGSAPCHLNFDEAPGVHPHECSKSICKLAHEKATKSRQDSNSAWTEELSRLLSN